MPVAQDFEQHRRELTGYCYRMLGSAFDADDAVQETMLRAWKNAEGFEGRASLRSWLYKIATNVCLDTLRAGKRRALPLDLGPSSPPNESLLRPWPAEDIWVTPIPDDRLDPAEIAESHDSVRLAFVTALQHLPPRQRAALILCEVLKLSAVEAAQVMESSVASVNSALQRARATLADLPDHQRPGTVDPENAELLAKYVDAFQRYDMAALLNLLHEDAIQTMPPFELWIQGNVNITKWMLEPTPSLCRGSVLVPVRANGVQAWGQFKPDPEHGGYKAWGLQVHEASGGKFARLTWFLDSERIFPLFGLPLHVERLPAPARPLCSAFMRVLFVHQNHSSPPGLVGDAFASLGWDVAEFTVVPRERYHSPDVTVTFPDPAGYDAIVAFGAAWAVYDEAAIGTWIHDEIAFTRAAVTDGVPFLGICFGGQMLATALGGSVARAPEPEIGWHIVETDAPGLIDQGPWFQWHVDRFTVPDGVRVVARTSRAGQAFVSGRCLGLQFHPELTSSMLETWLSDGGKAELAAHGVDARDLLARTRAADLEAAVRARELVRRFVRDVASAPADATVLTPQAG